MQFEVGRQTDFGVIIRTGNATAPHALAGDSQGTWHGGMQRPISKRSLADLSIPAGSKSGGIEASPPDMPQVLRYAYLNLRVTV